MKLFNSNYNYQKSLSIQSNISMSTVLFFPFVGCIRKPAATILLIENLSTKCGSHCPPLFYLYTFHSGYFYFIQIRLDIFSLERTKMNSVLFISLFIGLTAYASASDVLVFTDSDFLTKVKQHDILLAEFYAPWCGHCKLFYKKIFYYFLLKR